MTRDTEATGPAEVYLLNVLAEGAPLREQAMLYGSAAITHLVTDREIDHPAFELVDTVQTIAGTSIRVYRNLLAQPRVQLLAALIPYRGDDGYRRIVSGSSPDLFSHAALIDVEDLERAPADLRRLVPAPDDTPQSDVGTAKIVEDLGHRVTIQAESRAPAVVVVSDAFLPHWSARVDGVAAPVIRMNYCFRGILVGRGRHTVELEYTPWRR